MSKPEFPDDYYTDRDGLLEAYEGTGLRPYDSTEKRFYCDFCAVGIPYTKGERVGQYLVDHLPVNNTPKAKEINWRGQLAPLAMYCTDCAQR